MIGVRHVAGGIVTGRFTDHHVHLQLVDHRLLAGSRLGRVVDLGAEPGWVREVAVHNSGDLHAARAEMTVSGLDTGQPPELWPPIVEYAGAFLTAPGGYPSDRAWAPAGSVREVTDAADAAAAVSALAAFGASCIKAVLHSEAGPVLDDDVFGAIVEAAAAHDLPVVVHAEGVGQAQRAARLGADLLAHAPFSERLSDDEVAEQAASVQWISTLVIHDDVQRDIAIDNVRRFAAAGGTVLYGTDMGNGAGPVDLRTDELDALREAGIDGMRLLEALAPSGPEALFLPDGDPVAARPLTPADLEA
ncbi:hydrolase [uncultured Microbacterium sp.]|uniref:hydrolase n=1 Tax=uncultured Microbacterium sp. TaxID=191216 RepID=UPI00260F148B|nr:hydrolase [uncultured Microbacterium sp.]